MPTIGFDISPSKVASYKASLTPTGEVSTADLSSNPAQMHHRPERPGRSRHRHRGGAHAGERSSIARLRATAFARQAIGPHLKHGAPWCSNPPFIRERPRKSVSGTGAAFRQESGKPISGWVIRRSASIWATRERTLRKIMKIVSGDTPETLERPRRRLWKSGRRWHFQSFQHSGGRGGQSHRKPQRDINIAFMNELAIIFNKMGPDTREVLDAAGTKWNFLVHPWAGWRHCIGVDPYYLTYQAENMATTPRLSCPAAASTMAWASSLASRP